MTRCVPILAAAVAVACSACASGVRRQELPSAPIAIAYREPEPARRRAELLGRDPAVLPDRAGVARVDDVSAYLGRLLGRGPEIDEQELLARLYLLDPATGELSEVRAALPGATPLDWSADHRLLLFSQTVEGLPQLFEYDSESREVRPLTHGPEAHPEGCYGPDGRLVATGARVRHGRVYSRIHLARRGGTDLRPISPGPQDHGPACAPDGSAVVWVGLTARGPHLFSRIPAVDGEVRELVPGREPDFTSDGSWVVYSAPSRGSWKLYRIRADGTARSPLGRQILEEQQPAVSPDGRLVVYVTETDHRASLYVRRFDGSGDRILFQDGDATFPTW